MQWRDGALISATIKSHKGGPLRIRYHDAEQEYKTVVGQTLLLDADLLIRDSRE